MNRYKLYLIDRIECEDKIDENKYFKRLGKKKQKRRNQVRIKHQKQLNKD